MEGKVTRHQLFGCFIATMGLVGCKTVPGSGCDRPEVPPQQPLRLNVTREVPARSFLAVVIDKATNQPVRQASISISELRRGAYTDTLGVALVPGLPRGAHTVSIRQIGYVPRSERIYMPDSSGVIGVYELTRDTVMLCNVTVVRAPGSTRLGTPATPSQDKSR